MPCPYRVVSQRALETAEIRRDVRRYLGEEGNGRRNSSVYSSEPAGSVPLLKSGKG
jgi:hypothetical protein